MNPTDQIQSAPKGVSPGTPVDVPLFAPSVRPAHPREFRNLSLGVGLLVLAAIAYWLGFYLAGHSGTRALIASFGTFGLLVLLFRTRMLHQRHGILVAVGAIALFAVAIPFVERIALKLDNFARTKLAAGPVLAAAPQPVVPPKPAPPVQPANLPAKPPADEIVRELILPPPDASAGRLIRLKEDANVVIGGRKFVIRKGTEFPFKTFADGMVTFVANGQEVTLDAQSVTFTGQSQESSTEITKLAMDELKKRYPAVFQRDTPENAIFVQRTNELRIELPDFFKNPRWPFELAEELAASEGWKRADQPEAEAAPAPAPKVPPAPESAPGQEAPPPVPK